MKSFWEFYEKIKETVAPGQPAPAQQPMQQPQQLPQQGQGTSPPVPPPDPNLTNGMKALGMVQDPKFKQLWGNFQKQLQGAGIQVPGMQPAPSQTPQPQPQIAPRPAPTSPPQTPPVQPHA